MIYADHNGTCPPLPAVREYLIKRMSSTVFANSNATHSLGQQIFSNMKQCRDVMADILGCEPDQIVFNSGSSEGINHLLHSIIKKNQKRFIIASPIEHSAVYETIRYFEKNYNQKIIWLPMTPKGYVDFDQVKKVIDEYQNDISFVTLMAANNETGIIQPFQKVNDYCLEKNIPFFCDTTQWIGKHPFHFQQSRLQYAVLAGHKCGALPGIGAMIVEDPTTLTPFIYGGSQENGHRAGTQNYLGIETLYLALKEFQQKQLQFSELLEKRIAFEKEIKNLFPNIVIIGENSPRLAGTTLMAYPGIHGQAVQIELESQDVFVTTSSACSDNDPHTSRVMQNMGYDDQIGRSVIRISFSLFQNYAEYDELIIKLSNAYKKLSKIKI